MHVWVDDMEEDKEPRVRVKRSTKFMTKAEAIGEELNRKCNGKQVHQHLVGGRAKAAGKYPEELCRAICRGLVRQLHVQEL